MRLVCAALFFCPVGVRAEQIRFSLLFLAYGIQYPFGAWSRSCSWGLSLSLSLGLFVGKEEVSRLFL